MLRFLRFSLCAVYLTTLTCLEPSIAVKRTVVSSVGPLRKSDRLRVRLTEIKSSTGKNLIVYFKANEVTRGYFAPAAGHRITDECSLILANKELSDSEFLDLGMTVVRLEDFRPGELFETLPDCWNVEGQQKAAYDRLRDAVLPVEIRLRTHREGQPASTGEIRAGEQVLEYSFTPRPLAPFWLTTTYLGKDPNHYWRWLWIVSIPLETPAAIFQLPLSIAYDRAVQASRAKCDRQVYSGEKQPIPFQYCQGLAPLETVRISYTLQKLPELQPSR